MKQCTGCATTKSLDDFHRDPSARDGHVYACKTCINARSRAYYKANREEVLRKDRLRATGTKTERRDYQLRKKFGITTDEYNAMLAAQGGCGVCGVKVDPIRDGRAMPVDHDHATGRVRGILCSSCNRALGLLGDDVDRMQKAIDYLTAYAERT